ncbi:MAG TPA: 16S rRNA (uracil(1498)-N(3))-methyltransferase [Acidobacteriota bacterium]|nr:16S rRNA (uracil(1498)-N(3))-methyltransferase [Acidobacteriota bacterium]
MNLIILTDRDTAGDGGYRLTDERAEHVRTVLRASPGDTVAVGMLNGPQGTARIAQIDEREVVLEIEHLEEQRPLIPAVDLICALPRPQTLKKVLVTAATMGVRRLHLIRANRVEKSYFHSPLLQPAHYTRFLIEGLSQGRLTRLPEVQIHDRFRPFFEDTLPSLDMAESTGTLRLLPDPEGTGAVDSYYDGTQERLTIAVGPEGGWVPFEIDLMTHAGFRRFSLGRFTLRVETAVAAVLAQVELLRARTARNRA